MDEPRNPLSLQGRVAVVTGAGRGIGAAVSCLFARAGAQVAMLDRDAAGVTRSAEAIGLAGGEALAFPTDITDGFAVERTLDGVVDEWGRLDILVNNAGMRREASLQELTEEDWAEILDVNLRASRVCAQAAVPHMAARGFGRILSAASAGARSGHPNQTAYSAAKAGIIGMTRTWARELGPQGITANAVAPGFIETDLGPAPRRRGAGRDPGAPPGPASRHPGGGGAGLPVPGLRPRELHQRGRGRGRRGTAAFVRGRRSGRAGRPARRRSRPDRPSPCPGGRPPTARTARRGPSLRASPAGCGPARRRRKR